MQPFLCPTSWQVTEAWHSPHRKRRPALWDPGWTRGNRSCHIWRQPKEGQTAALRPLTSPCLFTCLSAHLVFGSLSRLLVHPAESVQSCFKRRPDLVDHLLSLTETEGQRVNQIQIWPWRSFRNEQHWNSQSLCCVCRRLLWQRGHPGRSPECRLCSRYKSASAGCRTATKHKQLKVASRSPAKQCSSDTQNTEATPTY